MKTRRPAELGGALEQLLAGSASGSPAAASTEATLPELVASLKLSLDRLDDAARQVLPRLGVFQGGAFEADLLAITGLEDAEGGGANVWPDLRRQLEAAALIEAETVPGVRPPFLRFHPTLAPMLWEQLGPDERARLTTAHRQRYYGLANYLYNEDSKNPHDARAIAWRELPNLLHAARRRLRCPRSRCRGLRGSASPGSSTISASSGRRSGSRPGRRPHRATRARGRGSWPSRSAASSCWTAGRVAEAAQVFQAILSRLGDAPSYDRAVTLGRLGRCFEAGGRPDLAAARHREGIAVTEKLEQSDEVKRLTGTLHTDLADVLT